MFLTLTSVLMVVRDNPSSEGFVEASSGRVERMGCVKSIG